MIDFKTSSFNMTYIYVMPFTSAFLFSSASFQEFICIVVWFKNLIIFVMYTLRIMHLNVSYIKNYLWNMTKKETDVNRLLPTSNVQYSLDKAHSAYTLNRIRNECANAWDSCKHIHQHSNRKHTNSICLRFIRTGRFEAQLTSQSESNYSDILLYTVLTYLICRVWRTF